MLNRQNQLTPDQIQAAFGLCERPVKLLIRDYLLQFKEKSLTLVNGETLKRRNYPKGYNDQAVVLDMDLETKGMTLESLHKIPDGQGHLTVPRFMKGEGEEPGPVEVWDVGLHIENGIRGINMSAIDKFCEGTTDPDEQKTVMGGCMGGFFGAATVVFDFLKLKNPEMASLRLGMKLPQKCIVIEDVQLPKLNVVSCLVPTLITPGEEETSERLPSKKKKKSKKSSKK